MKTNTRSPQSPDSQRARAGRFGSVGVGVLGCLVLAVACSSRAPTIHPTTPIAAGSGQRPETDSAAARPASLSPNSATGNPPPLSNALPVSLPTALLAELTYRTNASPDYYQLWNGFKYLQYPAPRGTSVWTWNTKSLLARDGVLSRGATAISPAQGLGAYPSQIKFTLITKRIAITSGHYFGQGPGTNNLDVIETRNQPVYFLTANNLVVTQYCARIYAFFDGEDRAYAWFTKDVPDSIKPMRIVKLGPLLGLSAFWAKLGRQDLGGTVAACQHGYALSMLSGGPNPFFTHGIVAGDSGSTLFIVLPNEIAFVGSFSSTLLGTNFLNRLNFITAREGADTNRLQPQFYDLSGYLDP